MASRVRAALAALLVALASLPVLPQPALAAAAPVCPPANGHVWFVGAVYDAENPGAPRDDFVQDVRNFEFLLATLRNIYCIPDTQAQIFAFDGTVAVDGKSYPAALESAVKAHLVQVGAAAGQFQDSIVFFFLSSHGFVYLLRPSSCGAPRGPGSMAFLGKDPGFVEDGRLLDCELGRLLNENFPAHVRIVTWIDCSFCGGFSDSLTAASGTVPDNSVPSSSNIPGPNRIAITGCAMTTECFGSSAGGVSFRHMRRTMERPPGSMGHCDGWTAPGFPTVQGLNVPVKQAALNPPDGRCTVSEVFYGAVFSTLLLDIVGIQQQFRMKYGFATLAEDIQLL